jgi:peptidoglycan/xylan/chitin deacetylase (PgdA/CDA1 family)
MSKILEYHRFCEEFTDDYPLMRTYRQFRTDLQSGKIITMDDGFNNQFRACQMAKAFGIGVNLFVNAYTIGLTGYLTKQDLKELADFHKIQNHAYEHKLMTEMDDKEVRFQIERNQEFIYSTTGQTATLFVAPWNQFDDRIFEMLKQYNLTPLLKRTTVRKDTII